MTWVDRLSIIFASAAVGAMGGALVGFKGRLRRLEGRLEMTRERLADVEARVMPGRAPRMRPDGSFVTDKIDRRDEKATVALLQRLQRRLQK